jgi:diaminohydroxyphosphoribosylaminopyrimidine deaminase/5-amino-6-(5-phosphoribosylamino)uracil reductase
MSFSDFDRAAMARALKLAARGLETTQPNPRVGCVIARDGRIIAEGWHARAGQAHAEVMALRSAGERAAGATAYVTLEPCAHYGRTPPCVDALLHARVARVVFALPDPDPRVNGRGARRLREQGVEVESGLLASAAQALNPGFLKRMQTGLPWVRVKLAMSLDGRTALANGASRWITGPEARADVQHWRARSSAILTGVDTVLADDPRLDVRLRAPSGGPRPPLLRVVLDSHLRTPPAARLFSVPGEVLVVSVPPPPGERAEYVGRQDRLARAATVVALPADASGRVPLRPLLALLGERDINEVWVEAGPRLAGALLAERLVDELVLYIGPKLLGPQARPLVAMTALAQLQDAPGFVMMESRRIGADLRVRLRPDRDQAGGSSSNSGRS